MCIVELRNELTTIHSTLTITTMKSTSDLSIETSNREADNRRNSERNANAVKSLTQMIANDPNIASRFKDAMSNQVHQKYLLGATVYVISIDKDVLPCTVRHAYFDDHGEIRYKLNCTGFAGISYDCDDASVYPLLSQATAALNELNK